MHGVDEGRTVTDGYLPIHFDNSQLAQRAVSARRRAVLSVISIAIIFLTLAGVLLYVHLGRDGHFGELFLIVTWMLSVSGAIELVLLGARMVWFRRVTAASAAVGEGLAFVVSPAGIECEKGRAGWGDITHIAVANGTWGHGYLLRIKRGDEQAFEFPLGGIDILPGTLDSAMRAYSAGRHGVDLSALDD